MENKHIKSDAYKNTDADLVGQSSGQSSEDELRRFGERVTSVVGRASVRAFARDAGVDDKSLRQYMSGHTDPSRRALIGIAKVRGVSVHWLATGEGEMHANPADTPLAAGINYDLLRSAELAVHLFLEQEEAIAPPERIARLVIALYKYGEAKGLVNKDDLEQFLKLVA